MNISLSPETQGLLEDQMKRGRFTTADEVLRLALKTLEQYRAEDYDDLHADTRTAIEEGEAQYQRGEGLPGEQVWEELRARFMKK